MFAVTNLGGGVLVFKSDLQIQKDILNFLLDLKIKSYKDHYSFIADENDKVIYAVNESGHRFNIEDIEKNCSRLTHFYENFPSSEIKDFFLECEKTIYKSLLQYISVYPMVLPCLWWKTMGHVLVYGPDSALGLHCDNDINYQPGFEPDYQLGIRHVLASMIYFNSSRDSSDNNNFVGGKIIFPYLNIEYSPEAGDVLMFPANYLAAHQVSTIESGNRYCYLEYFGQGSSDEKRGVCITEPSDNIFGGQVWMNDLFSDYDKFIKNNYKEDHGNFILPLQRQYHSNNTKNEVKNDL